MSRYLQTILNIVGDTNRQIEINSSDFPFESLWTIAKKIRCREAAITLVVDNGLSEFQIKQLIEASDDHFNFKF